MTAPAPTTDLYAQATHYSVHRRPPEGIDVATVCLLLAADDAGALRDDEVVIRFRTEICGPPETATVGLTFGPGRQGRYVF